MLTQTAKYAFGALIYLAQKRDGGYCQTRDMAQQITVPGNYLGKTLQRLAQGRIVDSQKGLHGGFRLARKPEQITLYDILISIEAIPREIVTRPREEDLASMPRVYAKFQELSALHTHYLKTITLLDLLEPCTAQATEVVAELAETQVSR